MTLLPARMLIQRRQWILDERWTEIANQVEQLGAEDLAHPFSSTPRR